MSKIMQKLVVLMKPSSLRSGTDTDNTSNISLKGGNMCLNHVCMEGDAAFEVSGVYDLDKPIFSQAPTYCPILCLSPEKGKV